jgi:hypothetical protein
MAMGEKMYPKCKGILVIEMKGNERKGNTRSLEKVL